MSSQVPIDLPGCEEASGEATTAANEEIMRFAWAMVKPGLFYNYVSHKFLARVGKTVYAKLDDTLVLLDLGTSAAAQAQFNALVKSLPTK